ncbi:MAG: hypothetical protein KKI08_23735 [Armatimonadetes bacterium]|nr:hypothetical protein [Armatimonadota bacterium]
MATDWSKTDLVKIATTQRPNLEAMSANELDDLTRYIATHSPHYQLVAAASHVRMLRDAIEDKDRATVTLDQAVAKLPPDLNWRAVPVRP